MPHLIPFRFAQYRDGEIIFDDEALVVLTDQQIKHVVDYIQRGFNSCMIEDLPDGIYDMFDRAAKAALDTAIRTGKTRWLEDDEYAPQADLPIPLLRLLPKRVLREIDSRDLFEFFEVTSWEELFKLEE